MSWFALARRAGRSARRGGRGAVRGWSAGRAGRRCLRCVTYFPSERDCRVAPPAPSRQVDPAARAEVGARAPTGLDGRLAQPHARRRVRQPDGRAALADDRSAWPGRWSSSTPAWRSAPAITPATRGALRLLQDAVRGAQWVADLGAGSGVLAIAAARLGAARVYAIELRPRRARQREPRTSTETASRQRCACSRGTPPCCCRCSVRWTWSVANILVVGAGRQLLPVIRASLRPGGRAILAGILGERARRPCSMACRRQGGRCNTKTPRKNGGARRSHRDSHVLRRRRAAGGREHSLVRGRRCASCPGAAARARRGRASGGWRGPPRRGHAAPAGSGYA